MHINKYIHKIYDHYNLSDDSQSAIALVPAETDLKKTRNL